MDWAKRILVDDLGLLAVDKPAGLPSTGRTWDDPNCVQGALMALLQRRLWAVHQLDKGTTGINLFVRRRSLVARWQSKLARGRKQYLGLAWGSPHWERQSVNAPIKYDPKVGRPCVHECGKSARTTFWVVARGGAHTLFEARPQTGRTHQIRVHLAHLGHPLVGDSLHGASVASGSYPLLHCARIEAEGIALSAPLPEAFRSAARSHGIPLAELRG